MKNSIERVQLDNEDILAEPVDVAEKVNSYFVGALSNKADNSL